MLEQLKGVEERFLEIEKRLSEPDTVKDRQVYQAILYGIRFAQPLFNL